MGEKLRPGLLIVPGLLVHLVGVGEGCSSGCFPRCLLGLNPCDFRFNPLAEITFGPGKRMSQIIFLKSPNFHYFSSFVPSFTQY